MDLPPDNRIVFFRDVVPALLVCTMTTEMKPFLIELLMGLAPVWYLDVHLGADEIARFPHRTMGRACHRR